MDNHIRLYMMDY